MAGVLQRRDNFLNLSDLLPSDRELVQIEDYQRYGVNLKKKLRIVSMMLHRDGGHEMRDFDPYAKKGVLGANSIDFSYVESADKNGSGSLGIFSFSIGRATTASGANSFASGFNTIASGLNSHTEGYETEAPGVNSHAEGDSTTASGLNSHSEGYQTTASGESSHAEGDGSVASGESSHAEGYQTTASGVNSHAEGDITTASGESSHAEGYQTTASGFYSHAEGHLTEAEGTNSHAQGQGGIFSLTVETPSDTVLLPINSLMSSIEISELVASAAKIIPLADTNVPSFTINTSFTLGENVSGVLFEFDYSFLFTFYGPHFDVTAGISQGVDFFTGEYSFALLEKYSDGNFGIFGDNFIDFFNKNSEPWLINIDFYNYSTFDGKIYFYVSKITPLPDKVYLTFGGYFPT